MHQAASQAQQGRKCMLQNWLSLQQPLWIVQNYDYDQHSTFNIQVRLAEEKEIE